MRLRNLSASAAGVLLATTACLGQISSIAGDATGPDGTPFANTNCVVIDRVDIVGHYRARTDANGHYAHYALPLGTYKVSLVDENGKVLASTGNIQTRADSPAVVNLTAREGPARRPGIPADNALVAPNTPEASAPPVRWSGSYYRSDGGLSTEKWDFSAGGTYSHESISIEGGGRRSSDRGTFVLSGGTLKLTSASQSGIVNARHVEVGSRSNQVSTSVKSIQLLGEHGEDGIILDGVRFSVRHGW